MATKSKTGVSVMTALGRLGLAKRGTLPQAAQRRNSPSSISGWLDFSGLGQGQHTVYVKVWDQAGNTTIASRGWFGYDTVAPSLSISLNNGSNTTNQTTVQVISSASDTASGVSQMQFSNDGVNWSAWQAYSNTVNWSIPNNNGATLTVYEQVRDGVGNVSAIASDSIQLLIEDSYEPDNSSGAARVLTNGSVQNHNIIPVGDQDWVVFTISEPSAIILRTDGPSGADTILWLYNSAMTQLAYNDDGNGAYSLISYSCLNALPAGTYYARVDDYNNDNIILNYTLSLQVSVCPTPTATFTRTPTATFTRTPTATFTRTSTATFTRTSTATFTRTPTATFTRTSTATFTRTPTATFTRTSTATFTRTPTATFTRTPTATFTRTPTATFTRTSTATFTRTQTATFTRTSTATFTRTPTATFTRTQTATFTRTPTATFTRTPTAAFTRTPTATFTRTPTAAFTRTPTATFTRVPSTGKVYLPVLLRMPSPTPTKIPTATFTPTLPALVSENETLGNDSLAQADNNPQSQALRYPPTEFTGLTDDNVDYYRVTANAAGPLTFSLTHANSVGARLQVILRDSTGTLLQQLPTVPYTLNNYPIPSAGTYYIQVYAATPDGKSYTLRFTAIP
jgi:hypothetical protein